jgi:hypothetical protein
VPGPLYTAILRHAVLVMAALAICAATAALLKDPTDTQAPHPVTADQAPPAEPGMIPLTIPEISRLLAARLLRPHPPGHATHWLNWRRRHQAAHAGTSAHNSPETAESPWSASNCRLP